MWTHHCPPPPPPSHISKQICVRRFQPSRYTIADIPSFLVVVYNLKNNSQKPLQYLSFNSISMSQNAISGRLGLAAKQNSHLSPNHGGAEVLVGSLNGNVKGGPLIKKVGNHCSGNSFTNHHDLVFLLDKCFCFMTYRLQSRPTFLSVYFPVSVFQINLLIQMYNTDISCSNCEYVFMYLKLNFYLSN